MGPGRSNNIDDKTKIPLFAVVSAVPAIIGAILWLTSIDAKATAAQSELQDTKIMLRHALDQLSVINGRLSRIEGFVSAQKK